MCKCVQNMKILIFHIYYLLNMDISLTIALNICFKMCMHIPYMYYLLNMDISLTIALICLKMCMHIPYMYLEGTMSKVFDIGLRFCFIV